jgi:hypothetical protein
VSKRKPPLEVVRVVRARAVDDAAASLREAEIRAARAREQAEAARAREINVAEAARAAERQEAAELAKGATARDFAQLASFAHGNERAVDRARAARTDADRTAASADQHAEGTRSVLIGARTSLEVVDRHRERVRVQEERAAMERTDEAAEDAFAARRTARHTRG